MIGIIVHHSTLHFGIPSPHLFPQIDIPGEGDTSGVKRVNHVSDAFLAVTPSLVLLILLAEDQEIVRDLG